MLLNFRRKYSNVFSLVVIVMVINLFLGACKNQEPTKPAAAGTSETAKPVSAVAAEQWKLPISVPEGEFDSLIGWLSETEVVYLANQGQTSILYRYNLLSGTSEVIYRSDTPVVTGVISPSKQYILIHSSPSSNEGVVTIIDTKGNQRERQAIPSHELSFEWNPYDETKVLVSKFNEDWTFQTFVLNMNSRSMTELSLPQPFNKWQDEQRLVYINWDQEEPGLFAPLMTRNITTGSEKMLLESVIHYNLFGNQLMAITVDGNEPTKSKYTIYNEQLEETLVFTIPQLAMYSDWLIPYYDYSQNHNQFMTFQPVTSGDADSYSSGFDLVSYDIKNGKHHQVLSEMENEPIMFSPSGDMLLYGYQFDKVIDIDSKKVYQLFEG
ncbi:YqgU-like beta propeller domain-containing protein [Neobacillus sp. Marseille-QA0830]